MEWLVFVHYEIIDHPCTNLQEPGAEGRTRTDTEVTLQQFLRLPRLPFRHFGLLLKEQVDSVEAQNELGTRGSSVRQLHLV